MRNKILYLQYLKYFIKTRFIIKIRVNTREYIIKIVNKSIKFIQNVIFFNIFFLFNSFKSNLTYFQRTLGLKENFVTNEITKNFKSLI